MKKTFKDAKLEVLLFDAEDVIVTSTKAEEQEEEGNGNNLDGNG